MSAFMCSDLHISAMVKILPLSVKEKQKVGECLRQANHDSLVALYEERAGAMEPFRFNPESHRSPVEVLKLCDCFAYQACEDDAWEDSEGKKQLNEIRNTAIRSLPGYEEAAWGI